MTVRTQCPGIRRPCRHCVSLVNDHADSVVNDYADTSFSGFFANIFALTNKFVNCFLIKRCRKSRDTVPLSDMLKVAEQNFANY